MNIPNICLFIRMINIEEIPAPFSDRFSAFVGVGQKLDKLRNLIFCPDWIIHL